MTKYTRVKSKPYQHVNSLQLVAAFNLVDALSKGLKPALADLEIIGRACQDMLKGITPESAWGLTQGRGRPQDTGFTTAEIVSAFIELEYRRLGKTRGTLTTAKNSAAKAFGSYREPDPRKIEDYWRTGKSKVSALSDDDLGELLSFHVIPDEK